jgi:2-methylcitrate dehydratase PrpD
LAAKVVPEFNAEFNASRAMPPGMVRIITKAGKTYSKRIDFAYGHPQRPMTLEDLVKKFKDCASYSIKPPSSKNVETILEMVTKLEQMDDVSPIVGLLT